MSDRPGFIFITCQTGAESTLKSEIARNWPEFKFSFSRPGFVTFRLPPDHRLVADFDLKSTFAQAYGFSLGHTSGGTIGARIDETWKLLGSRPIRAVHVWQRDLYCTEDEKAEPAISPEANLIRRALVEGCPQAVKATIANADGQVAARGDFVLDCIQVEADDWWIGYHRADKVCSRYPGGLLPVHPAVPPVSRAWYKIKEALTWSGLPVPAEARFADLGCAPGGASQALLQRGHTVLGVDPAEVSATVLDNPNFRHLRNKTNQVRRREFRKVRWLIADMNVAPEYTLEAVESIVTHPEIRIRGMVLTLKLIEWKLAERIPDYQDRVRKWGFNHVWTRQLAHHRQEFCLAALKKPFKR